MNKIQKQLNLSCLECQAVYELLEIHQERQRFLCRRDCLQTWQKLLHTHYQEQIILHLAQQEAQQDKNHD